MRQKDLSESCLGKELVSSRPKGVFPESCLGKELASSRPKGVFPESFLGKELLQGKPGLMGKRAQVDKRHFGLDWVSWVRDSRQKPRSA